ncbi:MAG: YebC/PmpR family DNA-binding transcriptional regulator [Myxococcota bacterium]|nr:YebC/PmpR family DNA-binding transcriptional regulator [Myxococcota bacterium]
MGRFFEARKHTIFARSKRISKIFTRCSREIVMAVKAGGENPDSNSELRRAIQNARSANMPKDKIAAAIQRAMNVGGEDYAEVLYEGYAPHGIALMVVTATDNTTRTVANVRMHFNKCSGSLGNSGSVGFLFERMGVFQVKPEDIEDREELELELIDHGLEDMLDSEDEDGNAVIELRCAFSGFGDMQSALEERTIATVSAGSAFIPHATTELSDDQLADVIKLIDRLDGDDDVQRIFHNMA